MEKICRKKLAKVNVYLVKNSLNVQKKKPNLSNKNADVGAESISIKENNIPIRQKK